MIILELQINRQRSISYITYITLRLRESESNGMHRLWYNNIIYLFVILHVRIAASCKVNFYTEKLVYVVGTRRDTRGGKRRRCASRWLCGGKKNLKREGMAAIGLVGFGSSHYFRFLPTV
jgi:hypothetical protein